MRASGDDAAVQRVDEVGGFRRGAGGYLGDPGQPVLLLTGIDPLRVISAAEVLIETLHV